jgi:hypothetical protein
VSADRDSRPSGSMLVRPAEGAPLADVVRWHKVMNDARAERMGEPRRELSAEELAPAIRRQNRKRVAIARMRDAVFSMEETRTGSRPTIRVPGGES